MKNFTIFILSAVLLFVGCKPNTSTENAEETVNTSASTYQRIASLSGSITETLFALGHGDKVVAVDVTSTYPADALADVPRLGHVRQLNVEGVLSAQPDLILILEENAEMPAVQQLKESGIELMIIPSENSLESPIKIANALAEKLGGEEAAQEIAEKLGKQQAELAAMQDETSEKPKVLFIYARGAGSMMVAGTDTPAEKMIELSGGQNAVSEFEGFKALSAEGLLQAQPDAILMFDSGLQSLGGVDGLLQVEGIAQTPAGKEKRIIAMDGMYLLGFTPRAGEAALELAKELRAEG
ncbi:MAG: helical backbone metal receptor [Bacteroidota bacterium]